MTVLATVYASAPAGQPLIHTLEIRSEYGDQKFFRMTTMRQAERSDDD